MQAFWVRCFLRQRASPALFQPCGSHQPQSLVTSLFSLRGLCEAKTWGSLVNCVPLASVTIPHT